mmetsp:Transcript_29429/g.64485  ORF Transcript_29429/g.64485 Transcript_29429/m.64485 type:complete len:87 (+) Transcript_29429:971-1231(+)
MPIVKRNVRINLAQLCTANGKRQFCIIDEIATQLCIIDTTLKDAYVPGKCINTIDYTSDDEEILCGEECNPAEQLCHGCRMRMTFN